MNKLWLTMTFNRLKRDDSFVNLLRRPCLVKLGCPQSGGYDCGCTRGCGQKTYHFGSLMPVAVYVCRGECVYHLHTTFIIHDNDFPRRMRYQYESFVSSTGSSSSFASNSLRTAVVGPLPSAVLLALPCCDVPILPLRHDVQHFWFQPTPW